MQWRKTSLLALGHALLRSQKQSNLYTGIRNGPVDWSEFPLSKLLLDVLSLPDSTGYDIDVTDAPIRVDDHPYGDVFMRAVDHWFGLLQSMFRHRIIRNA